MAEKKELTVEERLAKATECYKDVKAKLDAANARIAELEANEHPVDGEEVDCLKKRIKELEDEITINGNSQEEIAKLNERLDNAKRIFAEQKSTIKEQEVKITELNTIVEAKQKTFEYHKRIFKDMNEHLDEAQEIISRLEKEKEEIKKTVEAVKAQISEIDSTL